MSKKPSLIRIGSILLFALLGCSQQRNTASIEGKIDSCPQCIVVLKEANGQEFVLVDSVQTNKVGEFSFEVRLSTPKFYVVQIQSEKEPIMLLVEPKDEIYVNIGAQNRGQNYSIRGSKGSELVKRLNSELNSVLETIDSLSYAFRRSLTHEKFDSIKTAIDSSYNRLIAKHRNFSTHFVEENRNSLAAILALNQHYNQTRKVFNMPDDFELFQLVDSSLTALYPSNRLVKEFHEKVTETAAQLALMNSQQEMLNVGEKIITGELPLLNGTMRNLQLLMGRYTLIDFWASWCSTCKANNVALRPVYEKYHSKGFEIIQFAIEETPGKVAKIIESDSLAWHHAADFKQWESPLLHELRISSIPSNYLIDKNGIIIERNLTAKRLDEVIGTLLP